MRRFLLATSCIALLAAMARTATGGAATGPFPDAPSPRPSGADRTGGLGPDSWRQAAAEARHWNQLRRMLSPGDQRKLAVASGRYDVQSHFGSDPELDPLFDRTRETVRSSYIRVYREKLQREYPLDRLLAQALRSRLAAPGQSAHGDTSRSWRLDVSPRLALGSRGYVGIRLAIPRSGFERLGRFSAQLDRGYADGETSMSLRYSYQRRFLEVGRVSGDRRSGDRYSATVALRF